MDANIHVNDVYIPVLSNSNRYVILWGGAGCFAATQKVCTNLGDVQISEIKEGDSVLCFNHETKENEYRKVTDLFKYENPIDKIYKIKMKDGTVIEVTENHKFFFGGSYMKIKDILLTLPYGNMEKNP